MARSCIIAFLFLLVIASTAHARLGSQMYTSGISNSFKELLKPVLSVNGHCGNDFVYHNLTRVRFEYRYIRGVAAFHGALPFPSLKSNLTFFLEEDLFSGKPLTLMISSTGVLPECAYLPRGAADSIPFSSAHIDKILSQFSIKPNSANEAAVKDTLALCELPALRDEGKACTTSLEEMEELAVAKLGKGAKPLATKMEADSSESRTYEVNRVELKSKNYMSCHLLSYPYAVHYCHTMRATVVYEVLLARDDGVHGEALVVCHRDTSDWDPEFSPFDTLNVKPGKATICHLQPRRHLIWISGNEEAGIEQVIKSA